jgi:uncharacterized ion transporter superfamily protein YfcC
MKKSNPLLCFLLLAVIVAEISVISYVVVSGKLKKTYYDEAAVQQMIANIRRMELANKPNATSTPEVKKATTSTATTSKELIKKIK